MQQQQFSRLASGVLTVLLSIGVMHTNTLSDPLTAAAACCLTGEDLPTGKSITPTAARGALFQPLNPNLPPPLENYVAGQAVATVVSPDTNTLLILTSGYNRVESSPGGSNEYVFVYDISTGNPVKQQVLQLPNTFNGIAWNPNGQEFYVSGGSDDNVHIFRQQSNAWTEVTPPIPLNHTDARGWESVESPQG